VALTERQLNFRTLVWQSVNFEPYAEQWEIINHPARYKQIAGGVGAGKSLLLAYMGVSYSLIENGLGWIVAPDYDQATICFDYLFQAFADLGLVEDSSTPSRGPRSMRLNILGLTFTWVTKSAMDEVALASRRPHVVLSDETAQMPGTILNKFRERAAENRAPVIMAGTFETSLGWYADNFERWQGSNPEGGKSFSLPTWTNIKKYPGGRRDPEILANERSMPPELFQERFGGVPCKPSGLVFKEFDRKTHCKPVAELYEPGLEVELLIDPATHTYPALFVQRHDDGTVAVLDEIYSKNVIGQQVIPKVVEHPYWKESCSRGVMDISGTRRQGANKSQVEVWADELQKLKQHPIEWEYTRIFNALDWYNALHLRLWSEQDGKPLLLFADHLRDDISADGSANGIIGELKTHRWPDRSERASLPGRPVKRNEDALSALGYYLLVRFGPVLERAKRQKAMRRAYWG
jgi:hypothetical protein